ncbi:MAG: hypothetical protein JW938_07380 [Candidatus Omnitrophica bacterium]|nr:hypothetical protein [Candidatus Omnitrophota bacterium]
MRGSRYAIFCVTVLFVSFIVNSAVAQEKGDVTTKPAAALQKNVPVGIDQQRVVKDFLAKKDEVEGLLQKQKIYEQLLTDVERRNDELDRIIENEKRQILIDRLREIERQVELVTASTDAG